MPSNLSISRPTPTTVLYTVSTRSNTSTLPSKIRRLAIGLLRLTSALAISFLVLTKCLSKDLLLLPLEIPKHIHSTLANTSWTNFLVLTLSLTYLLSKKSYSQESLLVIRGLGIQTRTSSGYYGLPGNTRFIPTTQIQDVFVHEAFKGFEVRFYLAVVVEGEEDVVVVFSNILPRRAVLETIWRGTRSCLYESSKT